MIKKYVILTGANKQNIISKLLEEKKKVVGVILPFRSENEARLRDVIKLAGEKSIPVIRPRIAQLKEAIELLGPEVLLSAGYPYILNSEVLSICKYNINIHPTLLPKYRGAATTWYIIANGETEGGVTIHFIDEGMDTGDIIAQDRFELTKFDTLKSYMRKAEEMENILLARCIKKLDEGNLLGYVQDEDLASEYHEKRTWLDSRFDPSQSLSDLYNFIRACDPERFPAFFDLDGERVGVKLFRLNKPEGEDDLI
jgi:methionyl-tRNA formyltransferase